jgi:hypothetical protein
MNTPKSDDGRPETDAIKERLREAVKLIKRQMAERQERSSAVPCRHDPENQNDRREIWEYEQLLRQPQVTRKDIDEMFERLDEYTRLIAPWGSDEWWKQRGEL